MDRHNIRKDTIVSRADGLAVSILTCRPATEGPKAVVQLVHGMCEHKERYVPFMEFLADNGIASIIHDHRGHGESVKSARDLGYFYEGGYLAMIDDIKTVTDKAKNEFPGLPVVLFGHSMGSMAVRSYSKRYDGSICGLIVCGCPSRNGGAGLAKSVPSTESSKENLRLMHGFVQTLKSSKTTKPTRCAISSSRTTDSSICSP